MKQRELRPQIGVQRDMRPHSQAAALRQRDRQAALAHIMRRLGMPREHHFAYRRLNSFFVVQIERRRQPITGVGQIASPKVSLYRLTLPPVIGVSK